MDIVLMGPPGVGKGTQAARIRQEHGLVHVSTGDVLRRHVAERTPLGAAAHGYMRRGELVPDSVVTAMALDLVLSEDGERGVLLDGFPRSIAQAIALDEALHAVGRRITAALCLEAPDELLVRRLTGRRSCSRCRAGYHLLEQPPAVDGICDACGGTLVRREDDSEEIALARLAQHAETEEPLRGHYEQAGVLRRIDGSGTVAGVGALLAQVLDGLAAPAAARRMPY